LGFLSEDALRWDEFTRHTYGGFIPVKAGYVFSYGKTIPIPINDIGMAI
jgi:hypothetical protein